MALVDLLGQFGVDPTDRAAVFALLRRLPLAPGSRVGLWFEYAESRGFQVTDADRATLSA